MFPSSTAFPSGIGVVVRDLPRSCGCGYGFVRLALIVCGTALVVWGEMPSDRLPPLMVAMLGNGAQGASRLPPIPLWETFCRHRWCRDVGRHEHQSWECPGYAYRCFFSHRVYYCPPNVP